MESRRADSPRSNEAATMPRAYSSLIDVDVFAISDQGHVRPNNEDHFLVVRLGRAIETVLSNLASNQPGYLFDETAHGFIVADGLGGHSAGEIASQEAIYLLLNLALHTPDWNFRWGPKERNTVMWRLQDRFRIINAKLLEQATAQASLAGMSTTLTIGITLGKDLVVAHVGDSRAYLLHQGKLRKLTRDHTLAQRLVDEGDTASNDPVIHEFRNILMQALGSEENECRPDVHYHVLTNNDQLLICSDGLTDMVEDRLIEAVLNESSSAKFACRGLVDLALSNGGRDNVTVIVAKFQIPEE
ncbi:MAG TPA: protein phosphatase 2C domain-containing protein [Pyrinomonadaceae bacterium]|nr:protein phosphatase 2C domain-containing protein [Pyrinomonadaceae bacterium]